MSENLHQILITLVAGTVLLLLFATAIIAFVMLYQRKKALHQAERERMAATHAAEILRTQLEIREESFAAIGRELHDNVGQVLSVVKLYLAGLEPEIPPAHQPRLRQTDELVARSIRDLRELSHLLNPADVQSRPIAESVQTLCRQVSLSGQVRCTARSSGNWSVLDATQRTVLYRMVQELVHNAIRHGQATGIEVELTGKPEGLQLLVSDNGKGFVPAESQGQGLRNLERRAGLIRARLAIDSSPGQGSSATIFLPQISTLSVSPSPPAL